MSAKETCWRGFWAGLAVAGVAMLATMFLPHAASMKAVEAQLKTRVEQALAAKGYRDISVTMDGQTAILNGAAGSADQREAARLAALTAAGPGGPYLGGVTGVNDQTTVGARVSPFIWNAERTSSALTLSGHAPDGAARDRLLGLGRSRFGGVTLTDQMAVAAGAPAGDWQAVAADALTQLGKLKRGKARLVDNKLTIVGEGEQAAVADVRAHYAAALPAPFVLSVVDLSVEGQPLGIPEIANLNLSEASAETCQTAFSQLMRNNVIEFDSGSATISQASAALLDNLALVARRCDRYTIGISGHTDATGDPGANLALSKARANAVRDYLAGKGVANERLTAEGFGQTRPRAPNNTPANRARNRRIEFNVS